MPSSYIPLLSAVDIPVTQEFSTLPSNNTGPSIEAWAIQRAAKKWGIYDPAFEETSFAPSQGTSLDTIPQTRACGPVLTAAHVFSLDMTTQYTLARSPQEDGAFMTYNKARTPYTGTLRMICDGTERGNSSLGQAIHLPGFLLEQESPSGIRKSFMNALEKIVADTKLYHILTPERIWQNANITGYRIRREATSGITVLTADITFQEVRSVGSGTGTIARTPSGQRAVNTGVTQPENTNTLTLENLY